MFSSLHVTVSRNERHRSIHQLATYLDRCRFNYQRWLQFLFLPWYRRFGRLMHRIRPEIKGIRTHIAIHLTCRLDWSRKKRQSKPTLEMCFFEQMCARNSACDTFLPQRTHLLPPFFPWNEEFSTIYNIDVKIAYWKELFRERYVKFSVALIDMKSQPLETGCDLTARNYKQVYHFQIFSISVINI